MLTTFSYKNDLATFRKTDYFDGVLAIQKGSQYQLLIILVSIEKCEKYLSFYFKYTFLFTCVLYSPRSSALIK